MLYTLFSLLFQVLSGFFTISLGVKLDNLLPFSNIDDEGSTKKIFCFFISLERRHIKEKGVTKENREKKKGKQSI